MIRPIVQIGNPVLRAHAKEVPLTDIVSPEIRAIIQDMKDSLTDCSDGLAIAAPQIGESLRIFVVSGRFFNEKSTSDAEVDQVPVPDMVFINPEITKRSRAHYFLEEGCLSVRWKYGETPRAEKVTLTAYDQHGKKFTRGASGLLAQVFQHETDHLNGSLFIDSAENIREVEPHVHE